MNNKVPVWFYIVAIVLLIWNAMGVMQFFMEIMKSADDIALLPEAEQALYDKYPLWTKIAFGAAVFGGFLGSLFLLLKSKWANVLFVISLIGIIIQMIHSLFIAKAMDVYGPGAIAMPVFIIIIGIAALLFTRFAIKKTWLR